MHRRAPKKPSGTRLDGVVGGDDGRGTSKLLDLKILADTLEAGVRREDSSHDAPFQMSLWCCGPTATNPKYAIQMNA